LSDQYGNNVDGEIWVPARAKDWIDSVQLGAVKDGSQKPPMPHPLNSWSEWAIAYADGSVDEERYKDEGEARNVLQYMRRELKDYRVPEEYWPALMERTVETVATSWRILSV
jgi:hypothetical protein